MLLLIAAAHKALAARPPKRRGVLGELKQVANGRAVHAFRLEPCRLKLSPPRNRDSAQAGQAGAQTAARALAGHEPITCIIIQHGNGKQKRV